MEQNHFQSIATIFDDIWYFSDRYKSIVIEHIGELLELNSNDVLIDFGGGTATFTQMLQKKYVLSSAYCIEPSEKMCEEASKKKEICAICSDAESFINESKIKFNKVLFKEVIHHIKNREAFWLNLFQALDQNGVFLIITRPQKIQFPLFEEAKKVFSENQPSLEVLLAEIHNAGFVTFDTMISPEFSLSLDKWIHMVRNRFMSDLSVFSNEKLEEGIDEIKDKYKNKSEVIIRDDLVLIVGRKSGAGNETRTRDIQLGRLTL